MKYQMTMDRGEWRKLQRNMEKIKKAYGQDRLKKVMESKANVFVDSAKKFAPVSKEDHFAYFGPHGKVKIFSGNLRNSIRVLKTGKFKKGPNVWVGPKWLKRARAKSYGRGKRVNAYYARIVESKFKEFMRPGFRLAAPIYLGLMRNAISGIIKRMNFK